MRMRAKLAAALSLVAMFAISGAGSAHAGPIPTNVAALSGAASDSLTDVRFRRGGAIGAGIAFGLIGAAIASQYYYPPYYGYGPYPYAYGPYAYGPYPYAYGPPVYTYPRYRYYGPSWGGPYAGYRVYPRYRHHVARHVRRRAHR